MKSRLSRAEAENLVREAAKAYEAAQSEETRNLLNEAVFELGQFNPPVEEWKGWAPAHRFMLDLLPEHLQSPDPLWGGTLF
jgi:hypothetical protein